MGSRAKQRIGIMENTHEVIKVEAGTEERPLFPIYSGGGAAHGVEALKKFLSGFDLETVTKFTYPVFEKVETEEYHIPTLDENLDVCGALLAAGVSLEKIYPLSVTPVGKGIIEDPLDEFSAFDAPTKLIYQVKALNDRDDIVDEASFDSIEEAKEWIASNLSTYVYQVNRMLEEDVEARVSVAHPEGYTVTLTRALDDTVSLYQVL